MRRLAVVLWLGVAALTIVAGMLLGQHVQTWAQAPTGTAPGGVVTERVPCGSLISPTRPALGDGFSYAARASCGDHLSAQRNRLLVAVVLDLVVVASAVGVSRVGRNTSVAVTASPAP